MEGGESSDPKGMTMENQYDYLQDSLLWFLEDLTPDEMNQLEDIIVNHEEGGGVNLLREIIGKVGNLERGE